MKIFTRGICASVLCLVSLTCLPARGETKVPCLIFSGNAGKKNHLDLSAFNRITFGENSIVVSSSKDETREPVEMLYSLYHHFTVGDAVPDNFSGVEVTEVGEESRIFVDGESRLLHLQSWSASPFSVGVFDIGGRLMLTCNLSAGDALTLDALPAGSYIAVATDGAVRLTLKFILH